MQLDNSKLALDQKQEAPLKAHLADDVSSIAIKKKILQIDFLYFSLLWIWYQAHWSQILTIFQLVDETGRRKTLLILNKAIVYFSCSLTEATEAIQEINSLCYFTSCLNIDCNFGFLKLVIVSISISLNTEILWMYLLRLRSRIICCYWYF